MTFEQEIVHVHGAGNDDRIRIEHVTIATEIAHAPEIVFDAFSGFALYDRWAPDVRGASRWLLVQAVSVVRETRTTPSDA